MGTFVRADAVVVFFSLPLRSCSLLSVKNGLYIVFPFCVDSLCGLGGRVPYLSRAHRPPSPCPHRALSLCFFSFAVHSSCCFDSTFFFHALFLVVAVLDKTSCRVVCTERFLKRCSAEKNFFWATKKK